MKKFGLVVPCCLLVIVSFPQTINQKLQKAFRLVETDRQLKHAITSLYIIDANNGSVVFDKNSQIGLAPASTQKIITSVTAFELLGKDYRYRTELGWVGKKDDDPLSGNLILIGNGDPTFGSWRWESTKPEGILHEFTNAINESGIGVSKNSYDFGIKHYETQNIPDGWIWQDLGNYYGAGASALNWRENQFDIVLASGNRPGDSVQIVSCKPRITGFQVSSEARSAAKGSGDNTFVYLPIGGNQIIVRGTIPINEKKFSISATFPNPGIQFMSDLNDSLTARQIGFGSKEPGNINLVNGKEIKTNPLFKIIYTHYSPSLDSIIYWFNKKSINLYGEALIKTFAYEKQGFGSTDSGVAIVKKFWQEKGLDEGELNIGDGSGLSPQTRVTTHAEVEILKYASYRKWSSAIFK
jgi:D-alanyl-D-alanine carboxypeptidase/D-alanyl-D-alanine-endopeptidase (penicillin-binding protein 4)